MKTWTSKETDILVENYNKMTNQELLILLPQKTELAIYKKAYKMGLRKTKEIEFINRSLARRGEKGANWHGGKSKTSKGYILISCPGHHRADNRGYVLEHILIFENETGISVPDNCCIHHLNGIKTDNRIENLCMMSHSAHTIMHHSGSKRSEETKQKISERRKTHYEQGDFNGKISQGA